MNRGLLELTPARPLAPGEIIQGMAALAVWRYHKVEPVHGARGTPLQFATDKLGPLITVQEVRGVVTGGNWDEQGNGYIHLTPEATAGDPTPPPHLFSLKSRTPHYLREHESWAVPVISLFGITTTPVDVTPHPADIAA